MPLRILRLRGLVSVEPRPRLPRHRHVLDVLPRHALPRARAPLQRAADRRRVPALDADRRGPLARRHRAARRRASAPLRVLDGGHGERRRRPAPVRPPSGRTPRSSRRSSSPASRSGSGIGNAFMPLLTIAMADVPAADAGLGSGHHQRLPADQRRARAGRAEHASPPTTRRACWPTATAPTGALIGGYHLAFITGAVAIGAGIVLAQRLLRPRKPRPPMRVARPGAAPVPALAMEEQAA